MQNVDGLVYISSEWLDDDTGKFLEALGAKTENMGGTYAQGYNIDDLVGRVQSEVLQDQNGGEFDADAFKYALFRVGFGIVQDPTTEGDIVIADGYAGVPVIALPLEARAIIDQWTNCGQNTTVQEAILEYISQTQTGVSSSSYRFLTELDRAMQESSKADRVRASILNMARYIPESKELQEMREVIMGYIEADNTEAADQYIQNNYQFLPDWVLNILNTVAGVSLLVSAVRDSYKGRRKEGDPPRQREREKRRKKKKKK